MVPMRRVVSSALAKIVVKTCWVSLAIPFPSLMWSMVCWMMAAVS
jgi:hypothetical protein